MANFIPFLLSFSLAICFLYWLYANYITRKGRNMSKFVASKKVLKKKVRGTFLIIESL